MRFSLKDYQDDAVRQVLGRLEDAKDDYRRKDRRVAFALSAITGAGKTVMASAVFEALFDGSEEFQVEGDRSAVVLWVTDDPNLNEQTRYRIMAASDRFDASRLRIIGDGFDVEKLDLGRVYFLNRQKLTAKTFITSDNKRTFTLWDTIRNTIEDPERTLYMVLDEAHRGMKEESKARRAADETDRSSTVLRLINGHNGNPAVPIVVGISATIERFNQAMAKAKAKAKDRIMLPQVSVDNAAVQASGLLKDTITLDLPTEAGSFTTVLAREAGRAISDASVLWLDYAEREDMTEPVCPLLVVQVPNKPSASELAGLLDAIYEAWPDLPPDAVANVFGEHSDESYGRHQVPYIPPQDVQDATHIRVLLAKDAISTGWDCPRAETLVSLRPAKDRTYITQLLGRLIRTPLARRIDSDERLNAVTCFLPHFNLTTAQQVADIMTGVKQENNGPPPPSSSRVLIDPITMLWNAAVPDAVRECFAALPSKAAPKAPAKPVKRLLNVAAEIALDELLPHPNAAAHQQLYAVLDGQRAQHKDTVAANVAEILTADIKRITANRLTQTAMESTRQVAADQRTVDDAFRPASRLFSASVANGYVKKLALDQSDDDGDEPDLIAAKATVAALAMIPAAVEQLEQAANQMVDGWFASLYAKIKGLTEERRAAYDEIKLQSKDPQEIDLVVPVSRIEMTYELKGEDKTLLDARPLHLLSDESGSFPVGKLRPGEIAVIDIEMTRDNAVAWYRNPSSATKDAIQVPWCDGQRWRSMQPDFILFSEKADGTIGASIVDPHGHHLQDALGKLRGLAKFAEDYGDRFIRIDAIGANEKGDLGPKGSVRLLDLTDPHVRKIVRDSPSAAEAYRKASTKYE
jgi:type III restriction enzyme